MSRRRRWGQVDATESSRLIRDGFSRESFKQAILCAQSLPSFEKQTEALRCSTPRLSFIDQTGCDRPLTQSFVLRPLRRDELRTGRFPGGLGGLLCCVWDAHVREDSEEQHVVDASSEQMRAESTGSTARPQLEALAFVLFDVGGTLLLAELPRLLDHILGTTPGLPADLSNPEAKEYADRCIAAVLFPRQPSRNIGPVCAGKHILHQNHSHRIIDIESSNPPPVPSALPHCVVSAAVDPQGTVQHGAVVVGLDLEADPAFSSRAPPR